MSTPVAPILAAPAIPAARLAQIKKTAQQFEAIFVRQMLSAAQKSSFGETITGAAPGSQGADSFIDMQNARFADIAAQKGAFGLVQMIEKQLIQRQAQGAAQPAAPPPAQPAAVPVKGG